MPRDGAGFVSLKLGEVWKSEQARTLRTSFDQGLEPLAGLVAGVGAGSPANIERLLFFLVEGDTGGMGITLNRTIERDRLQLPCGSLGPERRLNGHRYYRNESTWAGVEFLSERSLLLGPVEWLEDPARAATQPTMGFLDDAVRAAAGHHLILAANFDRPSVIRDSLADNITKVEALRPLLVTRDLLLTVDFDKALEFNLRLTFRDADAARQGEKALGTAGPLAVKYLAERAEEFWNDSPEYQAVRRVVVASSRMAAESLKDARIERHGAEIRVELRVACEESATAGLVALLLCSTKTHHVDLAPPSVETRLQRVARALGVCQDNQGHLPPLAVYGREGRPLLSWRVLLLPYLGEEKLFKEFRLDEAWDGPHNIRLVPRMPEAYVAGPLKGRQATTSCRAFTGKGTFFEGPSGVSLHDVKDAANSILLVQALDQVPWTKPDEFPLEKGKPLPSLGNIDNFHAAFADGQVRQLFTGKVLRGFSNELGKMTRWEMADGPEATERDKLLRAALNRNGGEPGARQKLVTPPVPARAPEKR
jgi:hypothetical protein